MKRWMGILLCTVVCGMLLGFPVRAEEIPAELLPIAEVKELPPGTPEVSFLGWVVWAENDWVIVQDDSGSICVAVPEAFSLGDELLITGQTGEELFEAEEISWESSGSMPAEEATLSELEAEIRTMLQGCWLEAGMLTQGDHEIEVWTEEETEGWADVWGIWVDDCFYADTVEPREGLKRKQNVWFGLLDAHSDLSDGLGTPQEAFSYASQVENMDFFALTDHSDSFDHSREGEITLDGTAISESWAEGKQAAADITREDFVGIFGYEMSWSEDLCVGHINTFGTPGWQTARQPGMRRLENYSKALAKVPGAVSQFNHPGPFYGSFGEFETYDAASDRVIQLLQVEGEGGESFYSYYIRALDRGWHVAPTVGQDNHNGNWGAEGASRTAVLADVLTETALYEAMAEYRTYATQDGDLYIDYRLNGHQMGSIITDGDTLEVTAAIEDPTDAVIGRVEVIGTGGKVLESCEIDAPLGEVAIDVPSGHPYYFLRIIQPDGDRAVTAPVWVNDFSDIGIASFTCNEKTLQTGQTATLKLSLYNREPVPFEVSSVRLLVEDAVIASFCAAGDMRYQCPFSWEQPGSITVKAEVLGSVEGMERKYESFLTLTIDGPEATESDIASVRDGEAGRIYAIEGYAVSGNSNPHTTFPDTIYVQDATGGIPVAGKFSQSISVGTPLAVHGILREGETEPYLELTFCQILQEDGYYFDPEPVECREGMDFEDLGGSLVKLEGTVESRKLTTDRIGVYEFTLLDSQGDTAMVSIDPNILSGSRGTNELAAQLKPGNLVRVVGLLSRDEQGESFLRVRNCDEVMGEAPPAKKQVSDQTNPYNGEGPIGRVFLICKGKLAEMVAFARELWYSF